MNNKCRKKHGCQCGGHGNVTCKAGPFRAIDAACISKNDCSGGCQTCVNAYHANVADVAHNAEHAGIADLAHNAENANVANVAHNAENLNGIDSTKFLRSDTSGTLNGNLTINGNLEVNGTFIQIPNVPFACSAATAGALYYDTTQNKLLLCNGTIFEVIN